MNYILAVKSEMKVNFWF